MQELISKGTHCPRLFLRLKDMGRPEEIAQGHNPVYAIILIGENAYIMDWKTIFTMIFLKMV